MQFSRKNRDRLLLKKSYSGDAMKDSEKVAELADLETSYTQLENTIDPFDLIAFKGGDIISSTVVFLTRQSKKHSENCEI